MMNYDDRLVLLKVICNANRFFYIMKNSLKNSSSENFIKINALVGEIFRENTVSHLNGF